MEQSLDLLVRHCESEQLHLSGTIQPHGALIALDGRSGIVTHASANLVAHTGTEARDAVGRPVGALAWFPGDALAALPEQAGKSLALGNAIETPAPARPESGASD